MAKFRFRLQSYLSLKEKLEDQRKLEYGQALAKLEEERQKKRNLENERAERTLQFKEMIAIKIEPLEISQYNMYIQLLKIRIENQQLVIERAEKVAEAARLILVEAMKEKKTLQSLRDKDFEEFKIEERRAEQRVNDEIVSYKYSNKE